MRRILSIPLSAAVLLAAAEAVFSEDKPGESTAETKKAVGGGLSWLGRHQFEGKWSASDFVKACPGTADGKACACPGSESLSDAGSSAAALLAYLGAGITHKHGGDARKPVLEIFKYFHAAQAPDGTFQNGKAAWWFDQAACAMALCEAFSLTNKSPLLKGMAENSASALLSMQKEDGGWSEGEKSDVVSTAWAAMALRAAMLGGIEVPEDALGRAKAWIEKITDLRAGKAGYTSRTDDVPWSSGSDPSMDRLTTTAAAACARTFLDKTADSDFVKALCATLAKRPYAPEVDSVYNHFGALVAFQAGGELWLRWDAALKKALVETQAREGCESGSWKPEGRLAAEEGRLMATALRTLDALVYVRYGRFSSAQKK